LETALKRDAKAGDVEALSVFIGKTLDSKEVDAVLMTAIRDGAYNVVSFMIKYLKANVNAKNKHGVTALMLASANGNSEIVKALLEEGADVDKTSGLGFTALAIAEEAGHDEVVTILKGKSAM